MEIYRNLDHIISQLLDTTDKIIIIYGARQVGKTTLVQSLLRNRAERVLSINADEERHIEILSSRDSRKLNGLTEGYDLLFIDEAQRIVDLGINLKILTDNNPKLKIIVTGSSSFELSQNVSEPLTGRKWSFILYPIAQCELSKQNNKYELQSELENRLIWGSYPEIFKISGFELKTRYLRELSSDYLYKDILRLADIRNPEKLRRLLMLLAFQIGNEVSLSELGNQLDMSKETVARYIDLLEKAFVIFRLGAFSKNKRKEISKSQKYYFYDLGIRNVLIDNLSPLAARNDRGALWENFLIIERTKLNAYSENHAAPYFWRSYTGVEIDYVEERGAKLSAFEMKYSKKTARKPHAFMTEYEGSTWEIINQENWLDFVLEED